MLLDGKVAVVYGGAGAMGSAVAQAFAREGAHVFLAGRTRSRLEEVAAAIRSAVGVAETAEVDAMDRAAVDVHADQVVEAAGRIDISFNAISYRVVQNQPLVDMSLEDFMAGAASMWPAPGSRRLPAALPASSVATASVWSGCGRTSRRRRARA
jgi:3-oxoacyl-[acyl-carrier protein] reductase